ncbi:MAG: hypothetical protein ACFFCS_16990, partial [Candidatus Hodarchaeota archaeon]
MLLDMGAFYTLATYTVVFTLLGIVLGPLIIIRARKKELFNVQYLGSVFLVYGIYFFLILLKNAIPTFQISEGIMELIFSCPYFLILVFLKKTFHEKVKSEEKIIAIVGLILIAISSAFGFVEDFSSLNLFPRLRYFIDDIFFIPMFIIYAIVSSRRVYVKIRKDESISPSTRKRYQLFNITQALFAVNGLLNFIDFMLFPSYSIFYVVSVVSLGSLYMLINYLIWLMPGFFKQYLDRNFKPPEEEIKEEPPTVEPREEYTLVGYDTEAIIRYLSSQLSSKIQQNTKATRGLLRLALLNEHRDDTRITLQKLISFFQGALKDRLKKSGIENVDTIISEMVDDLLHNQS